MLTLINNALKPHLDFSFTDRCALEIQKHNLGNYSPLMLKMGRAGKVRIVMKEK